MVIRSVIFNSPLSPEKTTVSVPSSAWWALKRLATCVCLALGIAFGLSPSAFAESLHDAAQSGDIEGINLLIAEGGDVNDKDYLGATPLHFAAAAGHAEAVKLLIAAGSKVDARDNGQRTPLAWASDEDRLTVFQALVSRGADVNTTDVSGFTPLHVAARWGYGVFAQAVDHARRANQREG